VFLIILSLDFQINHLLDESDFQNNSGGTMYKKLTIVALVLFCLSLAGCKKDADVTAFISELDSFTAELVKKVDSNPTPAGVDDAQNYFNSKKGDVKAKWDAVKNVSQARVSEEIMKKLTESVTKNVSSISGLSIKYGSKDPQMATKLATLAKDYAELLKP
jgi:hypothetical protein